MPTILTVDDSRAVRTIISKQVRDLGYQVEEAEDGNQGLERLEELEVDLVLLDVTMPNLDGPGMLRKMRELGNQTPVVMLTSESKRSIVSEAMGLGIKDYILKPFRPEELRSKILSALGTTAPPAAGSAGDSGGAANDTAVAADVGTRQFIDVLVVDDMENVAKKLRSLFPQHLTLNSVTNARSAFQLCRERVYRVIMVDDDIPDVDSTKLGQQLKVVQPHASMVALTVRAGGRSNKELKELGFVDVVEKPFSADSIEDFLLKHFDKQDLVQVEDDLISVGACTGKGDRIERYFRRVAGMVDEPLDKIAAACFEAVIVDLSEAPQGSTALPKLAAQIAERASSLGLSLRLVGPDDMKTALEGLEETRSLPIFASLDAARASEAA